MEKFLEKVFNKKTNKWIMFGCACALAVFKILEFISKVTIYDTNYLIYLIPSLVWSLGVAGLIIYGSYFEKENFVGCGLLLSIGTLTGAFTSAFSSIYSFVINLNHAFQAVTYMLVTVACLSLATIFILWLLRKYFNVKVDERVTTYLICAVVALLFLAFVFAIVAFAPYGFTTASSIVSPLSTLAVSGLFIVYLYENKETKAPSKTSKAKAAPKAVKEEKVEEPVEEPKVETTETKAE